MSRAWTEMPSAEKGCPREAAHSHLGWILGWISAQSRLRREADRLLAEGEEPKAERRLRRRRRGARDEQVHPVVPPVNVEVCNAEVCNVEVCNVEV